MNCKRTSCTLGDKVAKTAQLGTNRSRSSPSSVSNTVHILSCSFIRIFIVAICSGPRDVQQFVGRDENLKLVAVGGLHNERGVDQRPNLRRQPEDDPRQRAGLELVDDVLGDIELHIGHVGADGGLHLRSRLAGRHGAVE